MPKVATKEFVTTYAASFGETTKVPFRTIPWNSAVMNGRGVFYRRNLRYVHHKAPCF